MTDAIVVTANQVTFLETETMEIQIGGVYSLTTDHPLSSYGFGVVLNSATGQSLMPSDLALIPEPLKMVMKKTGDRTVAEMVVEVVNSTGREFSEAELAQIKKFLSQHPNPKPSEIL